MAWKKKLGIGVLVLVVALAAAAGFAFHQLNQVEIERLDDRLVAVLDGGGNSLVLQTDAGAVVVDTKMFGAAKTLRGVAGEKIRAVINTHHHGDHTHGNPLYPAGTEVWASKKVPGLLQQFDADFWKDSPAKELVPNRGFDGETTLDMGEDRLRLVQLPPAHTGGGDIAILFEKRGFVHTGDIVVNGFYPVIDMKSGGSVWGLAQACDVILALPFTKVMPGHGRPGGRELVTSMRAYYLALYQHAKAAVIAGKTLSDAVSSAPDVLKGRKDLPFFSSLEKNLAAAFEEAERFKSSGKWPDDAPLPNPGVHDGLQPEPHDARSP